MPSILLEPPGALTSVSSRTDTGNSQYSSKITSNMHCLLRSSLHVFVYMYKTVVLFI